MVDRQFNQLHDLFLFFFFSYVITWLFWLPGVFDSLGWIVLPSFILPLLNPLGSFGPLVSAVCLTYKKGGESGVGSLLQRVKITNYSKHWLILSLSFFPILAILTFGLDIVVENLPLDDLLSIYPENTKDMVSDLLAEPHMIILIIPLMFLYVLILGGPMGEEFGWRGYAMDPLQERWNPIIASLVIGSFWSFWHLPLFFWEGTVQSQVPLAGYALMTILGTFVYTWVYNHTNRSVLPALLLHTTYNLSLGLIPVVFTNYGGYLFFLALLLVVGLVVYKDSDLFFGPVNRGDS